MDHLVQALSGAPWWAWLLLIILVRLGIKALRPRTIPIQRIALIPAVFIAWSIYDLYTTETTSQLVVWWIVSITVGAFLGYKEVESWHFHVDRKKGLLTIPGNRSTLVLIIVIYIIHFYWGYYFSTVQNIPYSMRVATTCTSAVATGFFLGRGILYFRRYLHG